MHIIIVDDHILFSNGIAAALADDTIKVEIFTELPDMHAALKRKLPDLLLLDIRLGKENGLTVGKHLLALYPNIKIIFISGYNLPEYHYEAIRLGAKGFISKSIHSSCLMEKLWSVQNGESIFPKNENKAKPLTEREKEIIRRIAKGFLQETIATELSISRRTVNNHLQSIYKKLNVCSASEAIVRGIELGVIDVQL
jgi:two-component system, NarL family, secretion system response regulator SalR